MKAGVEMELVTPPLDNGVILPGVTRQSVLELTREMKGIEVKIILSLRILENQNFISVVEFLKYSNGHDIINDKNIII